MIQISRREKKKDILIIILIVIIIGLGGLIFAGLNSKEDNNKDEVIIEKKEDLSIEEVIEAEMKQYDIEVAYLECGSTKIISNSTNKKAKKLAWVHCDLRKITDDPKDFTEKTKSWYEKFDKVICVSQNVREGFTELFGNTPESVVVYNTIDDKEIIEKSNIVIPELKDQYIPVVGFIKWLLKDGVCLG